jgi:hypothetical protein
MMTGTTGRFMDPVDARDDKGAAAVEVYILPYLSLRLSLSLSLSLSLYLSLSLSTSLSF